MNNSRALSVIEVILLVLGIAQLLIANLDFAALVTLAWTGVACLYISGSLLIGWREAHYRRRSGTLRQQRLPGWIRTAADITPVAAATLWLATAIGHIADIPLSEGASALVKLYVTFNDGEVLAVVIGILGWLILHIGFAHMYERADSESGFKAFDFPKTPRPTSSEYLYLGFTIGATFATSDVDVNTSRVRWMMTAQSILAFAYNAAVIAVVVRILIDA